MHQQVRTSTRKRQEDPNSPSGAAAPQGGIVEILEILYEADFNLRAAGGRNLDRGGEFVFAVDHGEHDDGTPDDAPGEDAAQRLRDRGYQARTVLVHTCIVDDKPGSLLACIRNTIVAEGPIDEIHVGTSEEDRRVPIQITTSRGSNEGKAAAD
jgi:hypothetical protein